MRQGPPGERGVPRWAIRIRFEKSANGKNAKKAKKRRIARSLPPQRAAVCPETNGLCPERIPRLGPGRAPCASARAADDGGGGADDDGLPGKGNIALIDIKAPQGYARRGRGGHGGPSPEGEGRREGALRHRLRASKEHREPVGRRLRRGEKGDRLAVGRSPARRRSKAKWPGGGPAPRRIPGSIGRWWSRRRFRPRKKDFVAASGGNLGPRTLGLAEAGAIRRLDPGMTSSSSFARPSPAAW